MEYLEGRPLDKLLKRYPRGMLWEEIRDIFEQCLEGLDHAAGQGMIHRDLRPSNVFITHDGNAKVVNFEIESSGRAEDNEEGNARPSYRHAAFRVLTEVKPFVQRCLTPDRSQRFKTFSEMREGMKDIRYQVVCHQNHEDYELFDMLGRGAFGEVFKGRRSSDGKLVAVKHLFSIQQASRFIKEAKLLQQYHHPDVVEYVDFFDIEGHGEDKDYYLVMEYLPGMPGAALNNRIRKSRTGLDVTEVIELFIHYLSALQFLHESPRPIRLYNRSLYLPKRWRT